MQKKKNKSKKVSKKDLQEYKNIEKEDKKPDFSEEQTNDYGGLPMRDLKKNLGCG